MDLKVNQIVASCYTNADGAVLYDALASAIDCNRLVTLDFSGVPQVTSSFVNSSLFALFDRYGPDILANKVRIVGVNRQVAGMLRLRLAAA